MNIVDKIDLAEALVLVRKLAERGANMTTGEGTLMVAALEGRLAGALRRAGDITGTHWLDAHALAQELHRRHAAGAGEACAKTAAEPQHAGAELLLRRVQGQIEGLESHPGMWGSAETLDFIMLTLVRYRLLLTRPRAAAASDAEHVAAKVDDRPMDAGVIDEGFTPYACFVAAINGESTNTFLHCILREAGLLAELPRLLGDFARWIDQEWPPEDGARLPPPCPVCGGARTLLKTNRVSFIAGGCDAGHWWNLASGKVERVVKLASKVGAL